MSRGSASRKFTPPHTTRPAEAPQGKPSRAELLILTEKSIELAKKHPDKAAKILSDWINQPARPHPNKKK
jgi:hypothetical protein